MNDVRSISPDDDLDTQLVAYLDGELDAEGCRRIEALLASDARVQRQLQQLQGAWDLLDGLPKAEVSSNFTRSTVEMIAVEAEEEIRSESLAEPKRQRRSWILAAVSLMAAAAVGFLATFAVWPHPNEQLLEDLSVLEDLDAYRQTSDLAFLRELNESGLFAEAQHDAP